MAKRKDEARSEAREEHKETSKTNDDLWAQAEGQLGPMAGVDADERKRLVQERYDAMVASDEDAKRWAHGENKVEDGSILGDLK